MGLFLMCPDSITLDFAQRIVAAWKTKRYEGWVLKKNPHDDLYTTKCRGYTARCIIGYDDCRPTRGPKHSLFLCRNLDGRQWKVDYCDLNAKGLVVQERGEPALILAVAA
jgi:hypothetical protein